MDELELTTGPEDTPEEIPYEAPEQNIPVWIGPVTIIEIAPLPNGAHRNQTWSGQAAVPEGYAVIPESMDIPESFPFVSVTAEGGVVTAMEAGELPPAPDPVPDTPSELDRLEAQVMYTALMTDTLLEDIDDV